jgi:hypothetical protein
MADCAGVWTRRHVRPRREDVGRDERYGARRPSIRLRGRR